MGSESHSAEPRPLAEVVCQECGEAFDPDMGLQHCNILYCPYCAAPADNQCEHLIAWDDYSNRPLWAYSPFDQLPTLEVDISDWPEQTINEVFGDLAPLVAAYQSPSASEGQPDEYALFDAIRPRLTTPIIVADWDFTAGAAPGGGSEGWAYFAADGAAAQHEIDHWLRRLRQAFAKLG